VLAAEGLSLAASGEVVNPLPYHGSWAGTILGWTASTAGGLQMRHYVISKTGDLDLFNRGYLQAPPPTSSDQPT